ncbi:dihydrofolate reductase [Nematocida major]|uniref:dihydrofolate reductase n=1 Tax=Nematocida major TaxID=1912982 RepID=UPI00200773D5|nr:dihydrofolate reductase [Nematocida major]KAH9385666.1 dihydrofolate reductase [Nematocida major]
MITILAAYSKSTGAIGLKGKLPWPLLKTDFLFMKHITTKEFTGVIMGRKTFESIGKPLPNRTNMVLTSRETPPEKGPNYSVYYVQSLDKAVHMCRALCIRPVIFGGHSVYKEALEKYECDVYITEIYDTFEGDAHFPVGLIDSAPLRNKTEETLKELGIEKSMHECSQKEECPFKEESQKGSLICENGVHYAFMHGVFSPHKKS